MIRLSCCPESSNQGRTLAWTRAALVRICWRQSGALGRQRRVELPVPAKNECSSRTWAGLTRWAPRWGYSAGPSRLGLSMYIYWSQGGIKSLLGVEMPNWFLECSNCSSKFTHSIIDDVGILSLYMPLKPEFSAGGNEFECPDCGHKTLYQRTDLKYCP